ncbi:MAG: hypothetical protein C0475_01155 [Planctomyces sp.]|nr:hypothetical protein [Planctomyces sp.]
MSLVPSATETLCLLGAGRWIVGRSHECDWPESVLDRPVLTAAKTRFDTSAGVDAQVRAALAAGGEGGLPGGNHGGGQSLYRLDEAGLVGLGPDLIVTQELCGVCSVDIGTVRRAVGPSAAGSGAAPEVVSLNPQTVEGVLDDVVLLGRALDAAAGRAGSAAAAVDWQGRAAGAVAAMRERLARAADHVNAYEQGPVVAFLEWTDPVYVGGHWTPQLIERAGGAHPLNPTTPAPGAGAGAGPIGQSMRRAGPSVRVPAAAVVAAQPEHLIVCPCGLSLGAAWAEVAALSREPWFAGLPAARRGRVAVVDGNMYFSRPGPRIVDAFEWLVGWLQGRPELVPAGFAWRAWGGVGA